MRKCFFLVVAIMLMSAGCRRAAAGGEAEEPVFETTITSDTTIWEDSYEILSGVLLPSESAAAEETQGEADGMEIYQIPYHIEYDQSGVDYSQYVIEDEEDFTKWNETDLQYVRWFYGEVLKQYGLTPFMPIELEVQEKFTVRYRALRTEDGLYLFEHDGGMEIWKDGKGVTIYCGILYSDFTSHEEFWLQDVIGSGEEQFILKKYDSGTGFYMSYIWVVDLKNMEIIEYEPSDAYFTAAMESFIKLYSLEEANLIAGYDFYLSDKIWNVYTGLRYEFTEEEKLRQEMCILYSDRRPSEISAEEMKAAITVIYRYDEEERRFVVDRYEVEIKQ